MFPVIFNNHKGRKDLHEEHKEGEKRG